MHKREILQMVLDTYRNPIYLEIGVESANNFFPIKAKNKIAVDPKFSFSTLRKIYWCGKNPRNLLAQYYEMTSDSYFVDLPRDSRFDVVFIDGLHTYQQSLNDLFNALRHLSNTGVIVLHDCNPLNENASLPTANGDVWRTICHLRSLRADLCVFVLDCDYGLGFVTKSLPESMMHYSENEVNSMRYNEFANNRKQILNLKQPDLYMSSYLDGGNWEPMQHYPDLRSNSM